MRERGPDYAAGYDDGAFDAALDAYQAREREAAAAREAQGDVESRRPNAVRHPTTFGLVRVGDYMTNEAGPEARWVEVVEWAGGDEVKITFEVPQPIGVGMHSRWCITRAPADPVTIDLSARAER